MFGEARKAFLPYLRSGKYRRATQKQFPMCCLRPSTCLQVQVLPRQRVVGPSSNSRLRLGETPAGGKLTAQRREVETNGPRGQRPTRASRASPNWAESVRLAHQAVVAFARAGTRYRAEPRACGHRRGPRLLRSEPGTERTAGAASNGAANGFGRTRRLLAGASNRTGKNSLYGMIRGGGGTVSMTWRPFATMPERPDTMEAAGPNWACLHSTRPVRLSVGIGVLRLRLPVA
jgi:hypothetical protein